MQRQPRISLRTPASRVFWPFEQYFWFSHPAVEVYRCKNGAPHWPEIAPLVTKLLKDSGYVCGLSGKFKLKRQTSKKKLRTKIRDMKDWLRSLLTVPIAMYR